MILITETDEKGQKREWSYGQGQCPQCKNSCHVYHPLAPKDGKKKIKCDWCSYREGHETEVQILELIDIVE